MKTELKPEFDTRKSFYTKANVETTINEQNETILTLISYNTKVSYINLSKNYAVVYGTYSPTTLRHIKEFLKQNNFKAETSKQIMKVYNGKMLMANTLSED